VKHIVSECPLTKFEGVLENIHGLQYRNSLLDAQIILFPDPVVTVEGMVLSLYPLPPVDYSARFYSFVYPGNG